MRDVPDRIFADVGILLDEGIQYLHQHLRRRPEVVDQLIGGFFVIPVLHVLIIG